MLQEPEACSRAVEEWLLLLKPQVPVATTDPWLQIQSMVSMYELAALFVHLVYGAVGSAYK